MIGTKSQPGMAVLAAIPAHDARTEVGQRDDGSRAHVLHRGHAAANFRW